MTAGRSLSWRPESSYTEDGSPLPSSFFPQTQAVRVDKVIVTRTPTQAQAKDILFAWTTGRTRATDAFRYSPARSQHKSMPSDELERQDLLDGICTGLRNHTGSMNDPAATVALRLLRHVAAAHN